MFSQLSQSENGQHIFLCVKKAFPVCVRRKGLRSRMISRKGVKLFLGKTLERLDPTVRQVFNLSKSSKLKRYNVKL